MSTEHSIQLQTTPEGGELAGLRILVVEDDYVVAADLRTALTRRGATVIGPVGNLLRIRELITGRRLDCALLDVNLNGLLAFEIARQLRCDGVPTLFTTGYDAAFLPEDLRVSPCLQKPVNLTMLTRAIRSSITAAANPG